MNCKQGDLARVVGTTSPNVGKIVRCVKLHPQAWVATIKNPHGEFRANVWEVEPPLQSWEGEGKTLCHIGDARLRPICDPGDDACDQTLEWLPVPSINKTKENA